MAAPGSAHPMRWRRSRGPPPRGRLARWREAGRPSRIHQRAGAAQVLIADCGRGMVGQGRDRSGWVVAGLLREGAGAHYEEVRYVPALQVLVEDAVAWI